jgi:hypothetical protein
LSNAQHQRAKNSLGSSGNKQLLQQLGRLSNLYLRFIEPALHGEAQRRKTASRAPATSH